MELDDPRAGELRVKMVAAGLCHSDEHIASGDLPVQTYPFAGGHEGAGIVDSVGPNTIGFAPGDKVVFCFIPACGRCTWCATGRQNLCDLGAALLSGARWTDGSYRLHLDDGTPVAQMCGISTFSEYTTVAIESAVKVPAHTPLETACLLGCGVGTGWGASVNTARVRPGDTVIVMGIGGIGANAVQGAAHAGATNIIAVDPVAFKRDTAEALGATHAVSDMQQATTLAQSYTNGQGAAATIITVGLVEGEHISQAFSSVRKDGVVVVVGLSRASDVGAPIPLTELTLSQKKVVGSLYGQSSPNADIPMLLDLYNAGHLKLDELVTTRYGLDDIARGYEDMHAGKNIRGVLVF
ncbi:putative alcohol dehydrogenase D (plasmid) [Mycobacterium branderi]|nr:putative alcohol dehydrogenase D [Mycobacterium branderi]